MRQSDHVGWHRNRDICIRSLRSVIFLLSAFSLQISADEISDLMEAAKSGEASAQYE